MGFDPGNVRRKRIGPTFELRLRTDELHMVPPWTVSRPLPIPASPETTLSQIRPNANLPQYATSAKTMFTPSSVGAAESPAQIYIKPDRALRVAEVLYRLGIARATWYARSDKPAAVKLGPRAVGWLESDIDAYLARLVKARDEALGKEKKS